MTPGASIPSSLPAAASTWSPTAPAAHRPYTVLAQALRQRHKVALGRVVLSSQRQLVCVRPAGRLLVLHVLYYPAQVRSGASWEAELRASLPSPTEQELAGQLIDAASGPIAWAEYRDDTAERLTALVEATLQGRQLETSPEAEPPVLQLLDALKQSVAHALGKAPSVVPAAAMRPKPRRSS